MEFTDEKATVIKAGYKGIVYENFSDFESSIFSKVYEKAINLTEQIIERNRELQKLKTHGNDFRNKEQVDNIIAFIGRRGTGKTSAMLSFMEGLKDHYKHHNIVHDKNNQYDFISLEWIDASLLENNEDIFEAILAKMFGELLKKGANISNLRNSDLDYAYRDLYQQFEKIYRRVLNLKKKNDDYDVEMPVNVLKDLSRSTEIRSDFTRLLKSYIRFSERLVSSAENFNTDTYLVIAIDDIDLNVKNGYEIIEEIHRYLMVPGLIVLVAINYEEMLLCCEKRYIDSHRNLPKNVVEDIGERAIQISEAYLEKVLPPYMRVYLPSLKKTDFALKEKRKIEINGKAYSIKEGIFGLIWEKTRVFYDTHGLKRHFMEPVTLRNLSTNYQLYHNMKDLTDGTKSEKEYLEVYDENYNKAIDDILFRFACDSLPNREYRLFIKWSEENIIRRGQEIVQEVISSFPEKPAEDSGNRRNEDISGFAEDYKVFEYSYGELLRSLYCMGRQNKYDKKLVHVLLAQYTVVFSRIFEHYKLNELNTVKGDAKNKNILKKLMGQSVGGSWAKYVLPRMETDKDHQNEIYSFWSAYKFTHASLVTLLEIEQNSGLAREIERIKEEKIEDEKEDKKLNACLQLLDHKEIKALELWIFFFSNYTGKSEKDILKICPPSGDMSEGTSVGNVTELQDNSYRIRFACNEVEFNIFNFVQNCFDYWNVLHNYYCAILGAVCDVTGTPKPENIDQLIQNYMELEKVKENSLLYKFEHWIGYGGLALPVYNFDITYNLIKRLVASCKEENVGYIGSDDTFSYVQKLFEEIANKLKEIDKFYNGINDNTICNFEKIFLECPVVEEIFKRYPVVEGELKKEKEKEKEKLYKSVLNNFTKNSYKENVNKDKSNTVKEVLISM